MVIDTSSLAAIVYQEPEREYFLQVLAGATARLLSAVTLVEAAMVVEGRLGQRGGEKLRELIEDSEIELVPFTPRHAELAWTAWRKFGKGNHPAGLNYGDCCVYALAKDRHMPILCKGDDFIRTDIATVTAR